MCLCPSTWDVLGHGKRWVVCPSPKRWRDESGETGLMGGMGVVTCSWQVVRLGGAATRQEGASGGCHPPGGGITIVAV